MKFNIEVLKVINYLDGKGITVTDKNILIDSLKIYNGVQEKGLILSLTKDNWPNPVANIRGLIKELGHDYKKLSPDGQKTYNKITEILHVGNKHLNLLEDKETKNDS